MIVTIALAAACASSDGEVRGGELTDGGRAATSPPGASDPGPDCLAMDATWSAIYDGLLGPTNRPGSCSFAASCHGSPDGAGATVGIECFDQKGCRQSLFDKGVLSPEHFATPEKSGLFVNLLRIRRPDGTTVGFMPEAPADYVFPDACVERIQAWIRAGAKDD